jgi:sulfate transport system ATP-binding protein
MWLGPTLTHDQDEALEIADRVVVMNEGRVEQVGTPDEVFHGPRTQFVMGFLGQVNQFYGRIEGGRLKLGGAEFEHPLAMRSVSHGEASVFIRPHELDVSHDSNGHPAIPARVERIHSAGPVVRIDLRTASGEPLHVEVTQDRHCELSTRIGDTVFVTPKGMRLFTPDYAI